MIYVTVTHADSDYDSCVFRSISAQIRFSDRSGYYYNGASGISILKALDAYCERLEAAYVAGTAYFIVDPLKPPEEPRLDCHWFLEERCVAGMALRSYVEMN